MAVVGLGAVVVVSATPGCRQEDGRHPTSWQQHVAVARGQWSTPNVVATTCGSGTGAMGDTKRRGNPHVAVARGHRDNSISLMVVGVRGASKRGNASTDNHLHTKQNAVSRPGVIKRERKGSSRGNVCQSTCVTEEHLCSTRQCATVVLMHKPPK